MSFDLDKVLEEKTKQPFTFVFDGVTYTMPIDVELEVLDLLVGGQPAQSLELLLGEEQWKAIVESPKLLGAVAMGALIDAYFDYLGITEGKSPVSSRSSKNMARPLRPTSPASTPVQDSATSEQLT